MNTDILIAGSGCAGLYCALHLPRDKKITIITKSDMESNDSFLAQGGICVLKDEDDYNAFFEDTMKAGHYENNPETVEIMIKSSRDVIDDLVSYGVEFSRNPDGTFNYTKEGAHSDARILFHKDITGKEITRKLLKKVQSLDNVTILEYTTLADIICCDNSCIGIVIRHPDGTFEQVDTQFTVMACGGIGGLFKHSTNYKHLTGDAVAIALRHGIDVQNIDYIQIHPTTLYTKSDDERSFLISESVRGEGAKLYGKDMKRFTDELLPRDLLTREIQKKMKSDGTEYVWEDMRPIPVDELREHFPNIAERCLKENYDITKECIPVVPAQHYFMGGIKVDTNSKTSMDGLYAIGETACNGVHGRNRLASNSLLESLVFAKRAARSMKDNPRECQSVPCVDMSVYADWEKYTSENKEIVLKEIEKLTNNNKNKGEKINV